MTNFMKRVMNGENVDIDDYIDLWHAGAGEGKPLPWYLGMTNDEYGRYLKGGAGAAALDEIISERRKYMLRKSEAWAIAQRLKRQAEQLRQQAAQLESVVSLIETRYNMLPVKANEEGQ